MADAMMQQRLQKIIAAAGHCSRRRAEQLIAEGRVRIDGRVATLGEQADPETCRIQIDGQPLRTAERPVYVLLNKPIGVVTSLRDPAGRPVVTDLVKEIPERLFPVGRLDINTAGLLLLTNDGELANRLAHPSHQVAKRYLVKARGHLSDDALHQLAAGVQLEDGPTAPARVDKVRVHGRHTWFEITIHEGRNRQVRRMCEALGHQVSRLIRIGYAFLTLDDLAPGQKRFLTKAEVKRLQNLPHQPVANSRQSGSRK
ncbi:MAG: pseudouridine synthase [Desulfuromonadales bacterium]